MCTVSNDFHQLCVIAPHNPVAASHLTLLAFYLEPQPEPGLEKTHFASNDLHFQVYLVLPWDDACGWWVGSLSLLCSSDSAVLDG